MKFLLDQCVPHRIGVQLAASGHDVVYLRDVLPVESADHLLLAKATEMNAVLISLNGDFSDITAYPPSSHRGIIAIQIKNHPEVIGLLMQQLLGYLRGLANRNELAGKLLIAEPHRIRIRS